MTSKTGALRTALLLIVASLQLSLARAQSVSGSGTTSTSLGWSPIYTYQFTVDAYKRKNGLVGGTIDLITTISYIDTDPGDYTPYTTSEKYHVESLVVSGNQAIVQARGKSDRALHTFTFIDNSVGSVYPYYDYFGFDAAYTADPLPLRSGDITVVAQ